MITIRNIYKSFGSQALFEDASLQINDGERFALVGPNGSGKTTLFKMMLREEEADEGEIQFKKGVVAGYLPQENAPVSERTVLEETLEGLDASDSGTLSGDYPQADTTPWFPLRLEAEAKAILMGLGFKVADFNRIVNTLSGGWAMRSAMARLLIRKPDLLLLDEPTNHLDLDSLFWLQDYLACYPGAVFIISHDRAFIDTVCGAIVSVQDKTLKVYHGDYAHYLAQRESEKENLLSAWKQQREEIEQMEDFIARNRVRYSTASRVQSMIKRLEKLERIELPIETKTIKIRFPQPNRIGARSLELKNVNKSYALPGREPIKVYKNLNFELQRNQRIAFVGHNGAGKSTLLKLLAGVTPADSGERALGLNVKTGYFSQHREGALDPRKTVLQEAMDNDRMNPELMVRTALGAFLFPGDNVFKKCGCLSGGEKSRLTLVKFLLDPPNVLLLDEPTTHLDIPSVEALIGALKEFEGTMCFISHDLYFINSLADHIAHIEEGRITMYPGNYDYFSYRQKQLSAEAEETPAPSPRKPEPQRKAAGAESQAWKEERRRKKALEQKERIAAKLTGEIAALRREIEELAARLSDPATHDDFQQVRDVSEKIQALEASAAAKEDELKRLL
ncbi:MAG: ABC-F family ATP-binding cassette domain-containing protein [Elusimicrobia bacterium]|nr:ABC-F family ATP-binding cassette domain-containing protein [Elusimicrobiota bacterium]